MKRYAPKIIMRGYVLKETIESPSFNTFYSYSNMATLWFYHVWAKTISFSACVCTIMMSLKKKKKKKRIGCIVFTIRVQGLCKGEIFIFLHKDEVKNTSAECQISASKTKWLIRRIIRKFEKCYSETWNSSPAFDLVIILQKQFCIW